MFDGAESQLTQTFGLGSFQEAKDEYLNEPEASFNERESQVFYDVSHMADPSILTLPRERAYRPIELTSVFYRELGREIPEGGSRDPELTTRVIASDEADLWAHTSASGWATEHEGLADFMFKFGQISARCDGAFPYLAELAGKPVATGMLFIYGEMCILAGASTVPEGRNRGAQNALLSDRLRFAAERGCRLAILRATPGSQSQKNAHKNGFQIADTRIKWQLFD